MSSTSTNGALRSPRQSMPPACGAGSSQAAVRDALAGEDDEHESVLARHLGGGGEAQAVAPERQAGLDRGHVSIAGT